MSSRVCVLLVFMISVGMASAEVFMSLELYAEGQSTNGNAKAGINSVVVKSTTDDPSASVGLKKKSQVRLNMPYILIGEGSETNIQVGTLRYEIRSDDLTETNVFVTVRVSIESNAVYSIRKVQLPLNGEMRTVVLVKESDITVSGPVP